MRLAALSAVIAGALVIGSITASAAPAHFDLGPRQQLYVNPSTGHATPLPRPRDHATGPRPEVHPATDRQYLRPGPIAPPSPKRAQLAWGLRLQTQALALAHHVPPTARVSTAHLNPYATTPHPVAVRPTLTPASSGFDWADAAVGAGIAAAIALLLTACIQVVRQRKQLRHP